MPAQSVTLTLPEPLYQRLRERAEQAHRSLEEETLEALATAIPVDGALPPELSKLMESLNSLDDSAVWDAARRRLPADIGHELESLHLKGQSEGLNEAECAELARLVGLYEQQMLVRAQAVVLLKQRGHDVSELIGP
ncbi:MAG: hypothetical protein KY476_07355 [Planctomycetes bacterium]|nr:hypothetical protein [Planctomycetota bacterium]